jgi:hypothetical protein
MSQELKITVRFKVEHTPGHDQHLMQMLQSYLQGKGVILSDDGIIEV